MGARAILMVKDSSIFAALVEEAANLDQTKKDRLSFLYRRHFPEMLRTIRKQYGAGPPDPEDVVHSAFANFAALPADMEIKNERAFLFRTAHNIALDGKRRKKTQEKFAEAENAESETALNADFSPERVFLGKEEFRLVEQAIKALPAKDRRLFLMYRVDELSYAEISRREGYSESGVRLAVSRAQKACFDAVRRTNGRRSD